MYHKNKKIRQSRKQIMVSSILPKNERNALRILSWVISFAFEINWPLITLNDKKLSKSFGGASNINVQKKTCVSTYTLCPKMNWYMIEQTCPRALIRIIIQIRKRYTTSLSHSIRQKSPFWFRLRYWNRNWKLAETFGYKLSKTIKS